jgi:hypothetical protein
LSDRDACCTNQYGSRAQGAAGFSLLRSLHQWTATEISQLSGFRVFEVVPEDPAVARPDARNQLVLQKALSAQTVENIAIFVDPARTQSLWVWMKRDGKRILPRRHVYINGQPGDLFLAKLSALVVDLSELDEQGHLPITEAANRVRAALDVEVVTKRFFTQFADEHAVFLEKIDGIDDEGDRRWYASVILNRLMFIWFLQKKGFVDRADRPDGNRNYLRDKLAASAKTKDRFFSHFLRDLFFEGFAKPEGKRKPVAQIPLGDIPYLNGGLFLPHGIEQRIEEDSLLHAPFKRIGIPDSAFKSIFELFNSYSWSLNDVPGGDDREINPAVLGYIFEKYINQKEFGAYYTRPEITEYLCEQTIHQLVIDAANKHISGQQLLVRHGLKKEAPIVAFESVGDVLLRADGSLCRELLQTFLPQLSILDPACGSGAFLVAALKTLLAIYTGLAGRAEAVQEKAVLQWVKTEKKKHEAPVAYWLKKKIITENLFGVDIMEEAVEIAKLRLFLALVASADRRDDLEPLPNIEFNLMHGNSLIGLLHVDPKKFDSTGSNGGQGRMTLVHHPTSKDLGFTVESKTAPTTKEKVGAHLAEKRAKKYDELLREKNRLVDLYKRSAMDFEDLTALKESIEAKKGEARIILNKLLLDEFKGLGIEFEQATWHLGRRREGRPEKRPLELTDISVLAPFHWAYEFDETIVARGGFDVVILNPPWDVFQTDEKEFAQRFEDTVRKKKIRIENWAKQFASCMEQQEFREAWLAYASSFPHQAAWLKNAPQYKHQISLIDGKKVATKANLYKNFLEQTLNLLSVRGRTGILAPGGLYTDRGSKSLREVLFGTTQIQSLFGLSNEKFIFQDVHHAQKFCILTFEKGGVTESFEAAFRINPREAVHPDELDAFLHGEADHVHISTDLVRQSSPDSLSIMEFRSETDIRIAEKMLRNPLLGEALSDPWNVSFTQEFNMTSDREFFFTAPAKGRLPLYEGKMIWQFENAYTPPRYWIDEARGRAFLAGNGTKDRSLPFDRYRLGFRDVMSNTNERTLISSIVPKRSFCGNTLPTLVEPTEVDYNLYLSAIFNSFVVDWMVRQKITNHCNFFYMLQLPVPRPSRSDPSFHALVTRTARLIGNAPEFDDLVKEVFGKQATYRSQGITDRAQRNKVRAEIDAIVAQLYDLTEEEFAHILSTFPLVSEEVKTLTLNAFIATLPSADDKAVHKLIKGLETAKVEFKEGAAFSSQRNQKSPDMIRNVLREVAAFLNSGGGNVILGVTDAGKVVGIANDIQHAHPKKKNRDGYELFLRNSLSGKLGTIQSSGCKITFHKIDNHEVRRTLVPASSTPVYLDGNLIVRDGSSSRQLNAQEAVTHIAQQWRAGT